MRALGPGNAAIAIAVGLVAIVGGGARVHAEGRGVIAARGPDGAAVAQAMAAAIAPPPATSTAPASPARVLPDAVAVARAAHAAGAVPVAQLARFRRVRDQVRDGWRAYQRVAVEGAALQLASARAEAEPLLALAGGAEVYADAALRLGIVLGHLGRATEAQAVLALAVALDPERPVSLAEFSPDVVDAVAAARRRPAAIRRLRITSAPAAARIAIDGVDVGAAPLEVDVARGQHVVVARAPGHAPAVRGVAVDDSAAAIALALEPDPTAARLAAGARRGISEADAQALVDAALTYAELDEVVVVADTARRGGPTLLVQRCAGLPARCSAVVELGYGERAGLPAAARAAWEAARAGELRYGPVVLGERATGAAIVDTGCRLCRSPWLWTGVGAAVAVGVAIAVVAASSDRPPPTIAVDPGVFGR